MNIIILSPHRDDAACSLALAIKCWLDAGHRVTILGIFTRSLSAPFSDADTVHPNDLLSYVSAMRRREDAEFQKLLPAARMVDLNLKDAPLRLRCSAKEVYTLAPSSEDTAVAKIQKALSRLEAQQHVDAVLIPLALGHHIDHLVVRNAALKFAALRAYAFYEDLPDAFQSAINVDDAAQMEFESLRKLRLIDDPMIPLVIRPEEDVAVSAKAKRRIVSVYASQVDAATIAAISEFAAQYQSGERVWANPAWLASGL